MVSNIHSLVLGYISNAPIPPKLYFVLTHEYHVTLSFHDEARSNFYKCVYCLVYIIQCKSVIHIKFGIQYQLYIIKISSIGTYYINY